MTPDMEAATISATVATLRTVASWVEGEGDRSELYRVASQIEMMHGNPDDLGMAACCPVCEEAECDSGCPLEPIRNRTSAEDAPSGLIDYPQTCTTQQRDHVEDAARTMRQAADRLVIGGKMEIIGAIVDWSIEKRLADLLTNLAVEAEAIGPNHHAVELARIIIGESDG